MTREIEELEQTFFRDPTDADAFTSLQRLYKTTSRFEDLVALFERRAAHLQDNHKAAEMLWRAAEMQAQLNDPEAEVRLLTKTVERDPDHRRAMDRLKDHFVSLNRWTDLLFMLQRQCEKMIESGSDSKKIARLEYEIGKIWEERFRRFDRAIFHFQRAFKADPGHTESIDAGRHIYRSMGQYDTVASLYEVELSTSSSAKQKVDLLLELGRLQWDKLGDLEAAARSFAEASQLRPGDENILETLGDIHASPEWPTPGGLDKAASIFMQIAQTRQSRGDRDGAISYLRRALGADPDNEAAYGRLERAYEETGRWEDLDRLYRQRLSVATEMEAMELQMRRGELLERKLGDRKAAREIYESVLEHEPLGGPASTRLVHLYRADKDYEKLLELHRHALEGTQDRATRIRLIMEMAIIHRDHLDDPEAAAHLLHEVLQLEPDHRKALSAYEDYFRQKGDYRNLSELLRFSAQSAGEAGAPPLEVCARLEELADVSERYLGDLEGALEAWQQISRLHPDVQRSKETIGRLGAKLRMWQGMVNVLERELAQAISPEQRVQALRRMAQVYYEKKADPQRTISILRALLQQSPHDENALRMLIELYERDSDHEGLAWTLERKLEGIITKTERITLLRQLADIYTDELDRPKDALRILGALLEVVPSDARAHDKIQLILEKTDDLEQLARAMHHRAQTSRSLGERVKSLEQLARLMDDQLEDPVRAAAAWEEVRTEDPENTEALEAMSRLYERLGKWEQLLRILNQRLALHAEDSPVQQAALLRQIGVVASEKLERPEGAAEAYERLSDLLPGDREALDALSRLYTSLERYTDLVDVLGRQIELSDDAEQQVVLAFKQGDVLEEKLDDLEGAARVFERIIDQYAPDDLDAHRKLKQLYNRIDDPKSACEIAERELFLTPAEAVDRLPLALEIARLWHENVRDDQRAMLAYERVLEMSADHPTALTTLRVLYSRTGASNKLVKLAPAVLAIITEDSERLSLLVEVAKLYESKLCEPEVAFEWYRRAYDLYPADPAAPEQMWRLADEFGLWEELISAHLEARKHVKSQQEFLDLTRRVAHICKQQLNDQHRAFQVLQQGLTVDPSGEHLLADLEAMSNSALEHAEMLKIYDSVIANTTDPQAKKDLYTRKASLAETRLANCSEALDAMLGLYDLGMEQEDIVEEIERLADASGRWEDALFLHEKRCQQATAEENLAILKHVATLLEHRMGALDRSFSVYLQAFILNPDDSEVIADLWRLATLLEDGQAASMESVEQRPTFSKSLAESTHELTEGDVEEVRERRRSKGKKASLRTSLSKKPRVTVTPVGTPPPIPTGTRKTAPPPIPGKENAFASSLANGFSPWKELDEAYRQLPAPDPQTRIEHLLQVADVWARGARQVDQAFEVLADAAIIDIENPSLERWMSQYATEFDRFDQMLQIFLDALERAADGETLIRLHLKVADLLVTHQRPQDAESHLNAMLAIDPTHQAAALRLKALYTTSENWQELTSLLKRQLDALGDSLSLEQRKLMLTELADLYQHTLKRPFDAVEALTRLIAEVGRDLESLTRLAGLYEELSIWPKQIDTLVEALQLTKDAGIRADFLLRIARTYDIELELPDRAIEAYQHVLHNQPDNLEVLQALQRLYEEHDRPDDLLEVLRLQVELSDSDPEATRPLLVRLARALEQQNNLPQAASYLERARKMGPMDPDVEEALARILVQTGRPAEAVQLIQDQINSAQQQGHSPHQIAALLVRLARLQHQQLSDPQSARQTLEQTLKLQPDNLEALRGLADLLMRQEVWDEYVHVLLRMASVCSESSEASDSLMTGARTMLDKVQDRERAITLFERVLQINPGHLPAVDALIELRADQPDSLEPLLRLKKDLIDDPHDKALTLIELGRVLRRLNAKEDQVASAYHQALELNPDMVQALDALSELYLAQGKLEAARALLVEAVDRLGLTRQTGPLLYRLGYVFEQLGQDDQGHRYLMDALRIDSQNLLLRIAVGLNRFRAGRWREALRHLQEVREHPDASEHQEASAEALYAAGLCESNLRRRGRSASFFIAALEMAPEHQGAIRELTQFYITSSQWEDAATFLERQLSFTEEAAERASLLKTLGDIFDEHLNDPGQAARCYAELLDVLPEEEAARLEVLPHILPVLKDAGAHGPAARAAEELSEIMEGDRDRRDFLMLAAMEWEAEGTLDQAEARFHAVLSLDPTYAKAALAMSRLMENDGRYEEVIELLTAFLASTPEPEDAEEREVRARLQGRLGCLYHHIDRFDEALQTLEDSLQLAEDIGVREVLAQIYAQRPDLTRNAVDNHRKLLEANPTRVDSLRALAKIGARQTRYRGYCLYEALSALDALDKEGVDFLASYSPPTLEADAHYPGEISDELRHRQLSLPMVQGMQEIFATLWEAAPTLFTRDLAALGLSSDQRVSPVADTNLAKVFSSAARTLGIRTTTLYLVPASDNRDDFKVVCMAPPAIIVTEAAANKRSILELRFLLGRSLELTRPAYILAAGLQRTEFAQLFLSLLRAFHPRHMRGRREIGSEAMERAGQLRRAIPFKVARKLGELFRNQTNIQFDSGAWRQSINQSANRVGLALCGDLGTALRLIAEDDPSLAGKPLPDVVRTSTTVRDLFTFAVSDAYYETRVRLGLGDQQGKTES